MSSDNFYFVGKHPEGGFGVTMGFASDNDEIVISRDDPKFDSFREAKEFAHAQYSEYGVILSEEIDD